MQKFKRKQKKYFIELIILSILIITTIVFLIIYFNNFLISSMLLLLTFVFLIILYYIKNKFDYYLRLNQLNKLVKQSNKPIKIKFLVNFNIILNKIKKDNFEVIDEDTNIISLYKIDKSKKGRNNILYIILLFKNQNISFNDLVTNNYFINIENKLFKKIKHMQRIFYQIKIDDNSTFEDANNIFFTSSNNEHLILLNILFQNNHIYFLHSEKYYPNRYYLVASNKIKNLFINNQ